MPSQHLQTLSEHVGVLEMHEAFEEVDGSFGFAGTCCVPNWRRLAPCSFKGSLPVTLGDQSPPNIPTTTS